MNESVCSCNCARGTARQFPGGRQVMEWTKGDKLVISNGVETLLSAGDVYICVS
jgi:hypothetical protein